MITFPKDVIFCGNAGFCRFESQYNYFIDQCRLDLFHFSANHISDFHFKTMNLNFVKW